MITNRVVAIQYVNEDMKNNVLKLVKDLNSYGFNDVVIFKNDNETFSSDEINGLSFSVQSLPKDKDTGAKQKNFILRTYEESKFNGFLHIIEDNVQLNKCIDEFVQQVEHTMHTLDYSIYFSTATDPCNYVFSKFCPRLVVHIDEPIIQNALKLPDVVSFTSHSNTAWTIYDYSATSEMQKYDEHFSIAMFMIIEYLARRKHLSNKSLYFMNQYLSVPAECYAFSTIANKNDMNAIDNEKMKAEDQLFKSMNIDYSPDNNVDVVLENLYFKINSLVDA